MFGLDSGYHQAEVARMKAEMRRLYPEQAREADERAARANLVEAAEPYAMEAMRHLSKPIDGMDDDEMRLAVTRVWAFARMMAEERNG